MVYYDSKFQLIKIRIAISTVVINVVNQTILTKLESDNTENYNFLVTLPVVQVNLYIY